MTQKTQTAFVENGIIKDLGSHIVAVSGLAGLEQPADQSVIGYPDDLIVQVPGNAKLGMTWDGQRANDPDPMAGVMTMPAPTGDPLARLQSFFASDPAALEALNKLVGR